MRKIIIKNTEYKLFGRFKNSISVRRDIQENPYCWDSTFHTVNMSWKNFKKFVKSGGQL